MVYLLNCLAVRSGNVLAIKRGGRGECSELCHDSSQCPLCSESRHRGSETVHLETAPSVYAETLNALVISIRRWHDGSQRFELASRSDEAENNHNDDLLRFGSRLTTRPGVGA